MEALNIMAGGAAVGIIASSWEKVKAFAWKFANLFIQDVEFDEGDSLRYAIVHHLLEEFKTVGLYNRRLDSMHAFLNKEGRYGFYARERVGEHSIMFRRGWKFIYYLAQSRSDNKTQNSGANVPKRYILFLRGTIDPLVMAAEAMRTYNSILWQKTDQKKDQATRFTICHVPDFQNKKDSEGPAAQEWRLRTHAPVGYSWDDLGKRTDRNVSMIDKLFFPDETIALIDEIKAWSRGREIYQELGVPWKRGWLLHGCGGTGKTALAAAFAHDLDMPLFVFNLSELSNLEFMNEWRKMLTHTPCIALIEDIDNVFHGRTNITEGAMGFGRMFSRIGKQAKVGEDKQNDEEKEVTRRYGGTLSFDVLLNCLDGVERPEGLFTIITTNHIEHIDPALGQPVIRDDRVVDFISTRPGRIDKAIELTYMLPEVKERMARHVLRRFPGLLDEVVDEIRYRDRVETPAQFQERVGQMALREYWGGLTATEAKLQLCSGG